ncbi:MAG: transglutaminase family protein [Pseudomonadota bacterium]
MMSENPIASGDEAAPAKKPTSGVSTDLLEVRHDTIYRYREPVAFGEHRGMFRPHDSHDLRLLNIRVDASPTATQRWLHDVFSNSITMMAFSDRSDTLSVSCIFQIVRTTVHEPVFPIADHAREYPFAYAEEQLPDLTATMTPEYDHESGMVREWAIRFAEEAHGDTWSILERMNRAIHKEFNYARREEPGVQAPRQTLTLSGGSCRDYAVLMLEAVRHLGFAARFVTGYLYDPLSDQGGEMRGAGATHAWMQAFIPGAGWIDFDPTNGLIASGNLIRTGVARTPSQAAPLSGSFKGPSDAFLGMDVDVQVTALAPTLS